MSATNRVRALSALAIVVTVVVGFVNSWGSPEWWNVVVLAVAVGAAEIAVVHLQFGKQRWTFSLTEAAIAVAFVHSPHAWTVPAVGVGVLVAQLVRRQEFLKLQFNVAQFVAATALGAGFAELVGGGVPGAIGGMGVFWLVNNLLIASAMAIMTGQKFRSLVWASAPLASIHSVGTSGIGILAAWLTIHAPLGLLALVVPLLLLWISYDEQTARAAEAQLYAELARLQERASGRSIDVSAQVVLTAAARLFASDDVEMVLVGADGPMHYAGDAEGVVRRRVDPDALDEPWVLRALGERGAVTGTENGRPWCSTVLGGHDAPLAVLVARRPAGAASFGRRDTMLAEVLVQQAESWLSIAELAASRDEALAHAEAAEGAARALGDLGADTAPSLGVLRESANRLARLAATEGPAAVHEIVDELYAVERAVASLLGAIALAAEPDLTRGLPIDEYETGEPRRRGDWTTTGVVFVKKIRRGVVPIAAMVFVLALAASCSVLAASVSLLHATHHVSVPMWEALLAGSPASLIIAVVATVANIQTTKAVRRVHARARTVDALQRRVRIADEVAERHRRTAENASAGMFELLSGLIDAEEGARGQLAAELHDTVAQSLTSAQYMLSDPSDVDSVRRAAELLAEAEEQVRAVMARTRPPALREGDLGRAVGGLRDDLRNRYAIEVEVTWPIEPYPLPLVTAITAYRFFQEALLNVVKHADVDYARASLRVDEDWVVASVMDEGPGFDPHLVQSEGGRHVGLGLLRERARLVGGSLEVISSAAMGTALTLRLPRVTAAGSGPLPTRSAPVVSAPVR